VSTSAYTRLEFDERHRLLLDEASALFTEHAFEEISMRQIAQAAGISKSLLYHYFPSKIELFRAAVADRAADLRAAIEPTGEGSPVEQLAHSLDAYLTWIDANARPWSKLLQSAASLPEAHAAVESFRRSTLAQISARLTGEHEPRPALRSALQGWLGYVDAAILDWVDHRDIQREQLRDMIVAAFGAAIAAAQQVDPQMGAV
jgi:AcrR family transcriptional regulator